MGAQEIKLGVKKATVGSAEDVSDDDSAAQVPE
eukprot:SAG25_NODE_2715_length_1426_cov_1.436323_1_plen_32_part_10